MPTANDLAPTGAERRRTQRVSIPFRIEVRGREPRGAVFQDETTTIDVNEHGCKFDVAHQVGRGDLVTIRHISQEHSPDDDGRPMLFQIVWVETGESGWTVGAMKIQDKSAWPMTFPAKSYSAETIGSVS